MENFTGDENLMKKFSFSHLLRLKREAGIAEAKILWRFTRDDGLICKTLTASQTLLREFQGV